MIGAVAGVLALGVWVVLNFTILNDKNSIIKDKEIISSKPIVLLSQIKISGLYGPRVHWRRVNQIRGFLIKQV